jgi:hypothetical protein
MHFLKHGNQEFSTQWQKPSVSLTILFIPDTLNQSSPDEISTTSFVGVIQHSSIEFTKMYHNLTKDAIE